MKRLTAIRDWWWKPKLEADARQTAQMVSAIHALTHVLDHTNYSLSALHDEASWRTYLSLSERGHAPRH